MTAAMAAIDYVVIAILIISALIGLSRGVVREVLSLTIWALAVILALMFADRLAEVLEGRIAGASMRYVAAFAMIFVTTLLAGGIVQWLVMRLVETTGLSGTDRLIGLLFGGLRGAVVCIVAAIALRPFVAEQSWWQASRLIPALGKFEADVLSAVSTTSEFVSKLREKR
jgi:membrane protein required for colicin V production